MFRERKKFTALIKQFTKYFGVALIGLFFDFLTLYIFKEVFGLHYILASILGFTVGLFVNYILSNRFVFTKPKIESKHTQFLLFLVIGVVGLLLLSLQMWVFVDKLSLNYLVSKVFATALVYLWNFFARRSLYHNEGL